MDLVARKPVFRISDQVRLKPATENYLNIAATASFKVVKNNGADQTVWMQRQVWAFAICMQQSQVFSCQDTYESAHEIMVLINVIYWTGLVPQYNHLTEHAGD